MNRVKSCPVCKTAEYLEYLEYMDDGWRAGIRCRRCGTKAIYGTCMEDAAYFWNRLVDEAERSKNDGNQSLPVLQE